MAGQSKLTPEEVAAMLQPRPPGPPPQLPASWTAAGLLLPFGDANPTMPNYDQLVVANIAYDSTGPQPAMRVSLYLLEDLKYFDFLFVGNQWYWLVSEPGQPPTGYYGPFYPDPPPFPPPGPPQPYYVLQVPPPDFLAQNGATYGNYWWIARTPTNGWVIPTPIQPNIPPHGTWFSWNVKSRGTLWRVLNLDNNNPVGIPILGSYYMAYLPGFTATGPLNLLSLISGTQYPGGPPSQMVSQRDIQYAMANPLSSAPCTLAQIQALIPGISYPLPQPPLPAWTDKTYIEGMTIGCDPIPYWTQVWYWWKYRHQRTSFVGYGVEAGTGTYNDRIDNVLYADFFTSPVYKSNGQGQWLFDQCLLLYKGRPCYPGVGLPRPDFVSADHGVVKATVSGNPDFGLDPEQTMSMIAVSMPRGANKNGIDVTSLFWFWFTDDQKGVLFSEGNYIDTVVDHDLQVIDYMYFEQNASDRVNEGSFSDPCKVDQCPSEPSARVTRHPGF